MLGLGCWSIELEPNSFFLDRANYGLGFQVRLLRGQIRMVVALQYLQLKSLRPVLHPQQHLLGPNLILFPNQKCQTQLLSLQHGLILCVGCNGA